MKPKTKQSQEALNLLIDNHPDAMVISDLIGTILAINDKLAAIFGKTKEELIGKSGYDNIETEAGIRRRKIIEKVIKTKKPMELIDQERGRWWKAIFQPIFDKEGNVVNLAYYVQDVTEKKEAESKIQESEMKYKTLFEGATNPIMIFDKHGNILMINKVGASNLSLTREECVGKSIFELVPNLDKSYHEIYQKVVNTGKEMTKEDFVEIPSLGKRCYWSVFQPIYDSSGKRYGVQIISYDITDRKKAEERLHESDERWRSLVENTPDDQRITIVDQNGKMLYANRVQKNRTIGDVVGKPIYDFIHKDDCEIARKTLDVVFTKGIPERTSFKTHMVEGVGEIYYDVIFAPIKKADDVKAAILIARDITERKKAEQILKESEQKFRDLAEQSPNMIFNNKKGKIVYINQRSSEVMGYKHDEFLADDFNFLNLVSPESHGTVKTAFKKHMNGKDITPYECILLSKDGVKLNALITTKLIEYEGQSSILGIVTDITQMKEAEQEIKKSKNYLQNVIDSASEIIFTIGLDYKIKTWNKSARRITGYKQSRVVGKSIKNLRLFENQSEIDDYIKTILKGKSATLEELTINTSFGIKRMFSVSPSFMRDESKKVNEILFVCRDITYEKERHGKLLFGQSYLISESTSEAAIEIFSGMLRTGHPGLYVGRTSISEIKNNFTDVTPTIVKLSKEKDKKHLICSNFEELIQTIEDYVSKEKQSIVLLDRIEYLIINSSFESVIKNIYLLNDMIEKHNCLLMLRISPSLLDKTQMVILKEELQQLPERQIDDVQLEETLFEILDYIQNENSRNSIVSYSRISKQFSTSKVTAQRRIESLIEKGLIFSKKQGRIKTIYITDKGKNLLAKRTLI